MSTRTQIWSSGGGVQSTAIAALICIGELSPDLSIIVDTERELSTTFCTDNRTVSKTSVTKEILLALEHFPITPTKLKHTIVYGFKRSFFPDTYSNKRRYVRRCINYYEKLTDKIFSDAASEEPEDE